MTTAGLGCGGHSRLGIAARGFAHACSLVRHAYEHGVRFFDTSAAYGTQSAVGEGLAGIRRDKVIISTKFPYSRGGALRPAKDLAEEVDSSLRELKTDYIDLYHLHGVMPEDYPAVRDRFYPEMLKMKEAGKIRFPGITERFFADTRHDMLRAALADDLWDVVMTGYNLLNPSAAKTILPAAEARQVGVLCMFAVRKSLSDPGQLEADIRKMLQAGQADPEMVPIQGALDFLAEEGHAASIPEAAYRFCRHTPGIHVTLTGTGNAEHLDENLRSLAGPPLPQAVLKRLEAMFGRVDCVSGQ